MKVTELRQLLADAEKKDIEKALVEAYKSVEKAKKTELDDKIVSILKLIEIRKPIPETDISALESEVRTFCDYAFDRLYFVPNRTVPKAKRSKWRFLVMDYIKQLLAVPFEHKDFALSTDLLCELYFVLSRGCLEYLFSTSNPFSAVRYRQDALLEKILLRFLSAGIDQKASDTLVKMAAGCGTDHDILSLSRFSVLTKYVDSKEIWTMFKASACKLYDTNTPLINRDRGIISVNDIESHRTSELTAEFIFIADLILGDIKQAYAAYCKRYAKLYGKDRLKTNDIPLPQMIDLSGMVCNEQVSRQIYELALRDGLKPRENLVQWYEDKNG